jgi:uncharacterized Zn finger protein
MNINQARSQANRNTRAKEMNAAGYIFQTGDWNIVEIFKPGNTDLIPDYTVNRTDRTCTCPDFTRHQQDCKHILWVDMEMDKREMEDLFAQYDARTALEF